MSALFFLGCGVIVGNLLARSNRKDDPCKVGDSVMTAIGLVLIVVSKFAA